jgi:hypothetical protein
VRTTDRVEDVESVADRLSSIPDVFNCLRHYECVLECERSSGAWSLSVIPHVADGSPNAPDKASFISQNERAHDVTHGERHLQ